MKTCLNCRCIYADDYAGQCHDCGAAMASQGDGQPALAWNPLAQISRSQMEERMIQNHDHGNLRVAPSLMERAREFVIGPDDE